MKKLNLRSLNRKIELLPFSHEYAVKFKQEEKLIFTALNNVEVKIEHVGSTAVEGLNGKPTIDILIVANKDSVNKVHLKLVELGYVFIPELVNYRPNRKIYWKGQAERHDFHIHLIPYCTVDWIEMISFRDKLRASDELKSKYTNLKRKLISEDDQNISNYVLGKDQFYTELVNE